MYELSYPSTWRLDTSKGQPNLDESFTIDAPGSCHAAFYLFSSPVGEEVRVAVTEAITGAFKSAPVARPFSNWGALAGVGVELSGRLTDSSTGRIRTFSHSEPTRSLVVQEFCFDDELPAAREGFDLLAASFRFR